MMQTRDIDTRAGYDLWSETYDESLNPVVSMDARYTMDILAPGPAERILDAGCGTGRNLGAIIAAGAVPSGMDFSSGMLNIARRRYPDIRLAEADLREPFPFEDSSFDAVLCALLGEHLKEPVVALREMQRVLRVGGRLVFSVFHPEMAALGMQAQFVKEDVGYRLGAERHRIVDYETWIGEAGFGPPERYEFRGDEGLVRAVPFVPWADGFPVLLVLEATKTE